MFVLLCFDFCVVVSCIGTKMIMVSSNVCSFEINYRGVSYRVGIISDFILDLAVVSS